MQKKIDFTEKGVRLLDFCSIKNTVIDSEHNGTGTELSDILEAIDKQQFVNSKNYLSIFGISLWLIVFLEMLTVTMVTGVFYMTRTLKG